MSFWVSLWVAAWITRTPDPEAQQATLQSLDYQIYACDDIATAALWNISILCIRSYILFLRCFTLPKVFLKISHSHYFVNLLLPQNYRPYFFPSSACDPFKHSWESIISCQLYEVLNLRPRVSKPSRLLPATPNKYRFKSDSDLTTIVFSWRRRLNQDCDPSKKERKLINATINIIRCGNSIRINYTRT